MQTEEHIISVQNPRRRATIEDFRCLMQKTEAKLNSHSLISPESFYKISASLFEKESCECLQSVCDGVVFRADDIRLVAGHSFPDIVAEPRFGVEIKSTISDQWTSVGSSIVESSRLEGIDDIYMLFGRLGSSPPSFRCRPYGDVLKDIHVTHSPRYTIDMRLREGETIFDKMNTTYNSFRHKPDKINIVRNYYRNEAVKSQSEAVPWWLDTVTSINMNIMRSGMNIQIKQRLTAEMLILFDSIVHGDYGEAAVWLCTRRNTINPSLRDLFSAGGRCQTIDDNHIANPFPHIVGTILEHRAMIEEILLNEKGGFLNDIITVWQTIDHNMSLYEQWIARTTRAFYTDIKLRHIDIESLIRQKPRRIEYRK